MMQKLMKFSVYAAAIITGSIVCSVLIYILAMGIPNIRLSLFSFTYNSTNVSLMPALINTIILTVVALTIALPIGIFAAIYLVEYAKKGNRLVKIIRITTETLSGIPSIVYGLFGMLFFVTALHFGMSILAGAFTVAIMVLPILIRTTEEALLSVPDTYREGSFGLGAGKLRTVFKVVLPSAVPGILSGIVLSVGRIVGETAALIFTAGTVAAMPGSDGLFSSGRTLAVHLYALIVEGLHNEEAYATAVVLIVIVIGMNAASAKLAKKFASKQN